MKKIAYPKEHMLITRPCLKAICCQISPASKLLSVLLYWYDHSTEELEDGVFTIYRTQEQLCNDAVDELSPKTLHDVAAPMLRALGYLHIETTAKGNYYSVYIPKVEEALAAYSNKNPEVLRSLLKEKLQHELEIFLIDMQAKDLEKFLIELEKFPIELEKLLIAIRKTSNSRKGRKASTEATPKANPKSARESRDITREDNRDISVRTGKKNHLKVVRAKPEQQKLDTSGIALSEEEQRIYEYWSKIHNFQPVVTASMKERFSQLAPVIASYEEMKSLYDYTRSLKFLNGKPVHPGNLTSSYTAWKSIQSPASQNGHTPDNRPSPTVSELQNKKNQLRAAKVSKEKQIERGELDIAKQTENRIALLEAEIARLSPSSQVAS